MKITFNGENSCMEDIYIKDNASERVVSVGETIEIDSQLVTLYTKQHIRLTMLSRILLFVRRFVLTFFNIVIMNFPNKWYENVEPYSLEPVTINLAKASRDALEIKIVSSKIDMKTRKIKKRQLYIDGVLTPSKVTYNTESINLRFFTYIYDMISLLIYACALVSLIFFGSGKIELPMIRLIYFIIMLTVCIPFFCKCVLAHNEKKDFEKKVLDCKI